MIARCNKGFTLVELIVVIVILAILIGVTIGGIYRYVGKSRENTDINNRKTIEDALAATFLDFRLSLQDDNRAKGESIAIVQRMGGIGMLLTLVLKFIR